MPKTRFSKEKIVDAAFAIACETGFAQLTIRNIARRLGSSIAPIYVNFDDVDELKQAVIAKAIQINREILADQHSGDPFLDVGIAAVVFARRYPLLFDEIVVKNSGQYPGQPENERFVLEQMKKDPQLSLFSDGQLRLLLLKMQALQAGLSLLARKDAYKSVLTNATIISILDETGTDVLEGTFRRLSASSSPEQKDNSQL